MIVKRVIAAFVAGLIAVGPATAAESGAVLRRPPVQVVTGEFPSIRAQIDDFGRFGAVDVTASAVSPAEGALASVEQRIAARGGAVLRTVRLDLLSIDGVEAAMKFRVTIDGRENMVIVNTQNDRVVAHGPDAHLFRGSPDGQKRRVGTLAMSACEVAALWSCTSQSLLWGAVNPVAGAVAGVACGVLWAASDACG